MCVLSLFSIVIMEYIVSQLLGPLQNGPMHSKQTHTCCSTFISSTYHYSALYSTVLCTALFHYEAMRLFRSHY